jgi:carboxyl-terminal processing protease
MRAFVRLLLLALVFAGGSLAIFRLDLGRPGFHIEGDDAEQAGPGGRAQAATLDNVGGKRPGDDSARDERELGKLSIVSKVIGFVRSRYVDPKRVEPPRMFLSALKRLQRNVTEVMIRDQGGTMEVPESVTVTAGGASKTFELARLTDLYQLNWAMVDLFQFVKESLPADSLEESTEYAVAAGLVRALDPHSTMMNPEQYKEMQVGTYGKFGGLGIVISVRKARLSIISVIAGTPADEIGLHKGDHIVQIGEESTINMGVDEAVGLMRGDPGTQVTIWIEREGWKEPRPFTITRALIRVKSVVFKRLDQGIGLVRIKNFNSNTTSGVRHALEDMEAAGPLKGLVLDLRGDPGGLLSQAIQVSDIFLKDGTIVTTVGQAGKVREEKKAVEAETLSELPLVVLTDGGSASASEIVAGALKYNGRAVVVGERTFGKATVQELYEIADGALKLTVAQYLTPGDILIQNVGINPDVALHAVHLEAGENELYSRELEQFGEGDLQGHLENAQQEAPPPLYTLKFVGPEEKEDPTERDYDAVEVDFPVEFSRDLLVAAGAPAAGRFLEAARDFLQAQGEALEKGVAAGLYRQGIRWNAGPGPSARPEAEVAAPALEAALSTEPAPGELKAGQTFTLTLTVTNRGPAEVFRLHGVVDAEWDLLKDRELIIGAVPPGETRSTHVSIEVPPDADARLERAHVRLYQGYKPVTGVEPGIDLTFASVAGPDFALLVLPRAKDGGSPFDSHDLLLLVLARNVGRAPAGDLTLTLKNLNGNRALLRNGRYQAKALEVDGEVGTEFEVHLNQAPWDKPLEFTLGAWDAKTNRYVGVPWSIPVKEAGLALQGDTRLLRATRNAEVRPLPDARAPVAGVLDEGSQVVARAHGSGWVMVDLGRDNMAGWLAEADLTPVEGKGKPASRFEPRYPYAAPVLALDPVPPVLVRDKTLSLKGRVELSSPLATGRGALMVFRNKDKVFYQHLDLASQAGPTDFACTVELEPGLNTLQVTARSGSKLRRTELYYVYYDDGQPKGKEKP